jgi:hypothetical protein
VATAASDCGIIAAGVAAGRDRRRRETMTMSKVRYLAAGAALAASTAWAAGDADLLRCRAIAETNARLACYDAIPLGAVAAPAAPASAPVAAAPGSAAAASAAADPVARFGLENKSQRVAVDVVESHIPGRFEGWSPGARIRLANGQVWQVTDGSRASYWLENPRVKIHRALFGSFILEIVGQGHAPRVQRVE